MVSPLQMPFQILKTGALGGFGGEIEPQILKKAPKRGFESQINSRYLCPRCVSLDYVRKLCKPFWLGNLTPLFLSFRIFSNIN